MTAIKPMLACGLPGNTLAEKLEALDRLPYPMLASYKLDGIRCLITPDGPQTRSGEPIPNLHVRKLLSELPVGLDGELVCLGDDGKVDFRKTTGDIRRRDGEPKFDYWIFDDFLNPWHLAGRYGDLRNFDGPRWTWVLKQEPVRSRSDVEALFMKALSEGYEGLILRDPSGLYKHGRSTFAEAGMVKVKPYEDAEAVIVSVFERMHNTAEATKDKLGHTKRSNLKAEKAGTGMLGGFVCKRLPGDAREGHFEVGRGKMTHEEARKLWAIRDTLPGKVIRFQHVTVGGYDVPRHGTFQGFREAWDMGGE